MLLRCSRGLGTKPQHLNDDLYLGLNKQCSHFQRVIFILGCQCSNYKSMKAAFLRIPITEEAPGCSRYRIIGGGGRTEEDVGECF